MAPPKRYMKYRFRPKPIAKVMIGYHKTNHNHSTITYAAQSYFFNTMFKFSTDFFILPRR